MRRGEIHRIDLGRGRGREFAGPQLAVVVSSDAVIAMQWMIAVVPAIDASISQAKYGVIVPASESGCSMDLRFLPNQLRSVDYGRFTRPAIGSLPSLRMLELEMKLKLELDLT